MDKVSDGEWRPLCSATPPTSANRRYMSLRGVFSSDVAIRRSSSLRAFCARQSDVSCRCEECFPATWQSRSARYKRDHHGIQRLVMTTKARDSHVTQYVPRNDSEICLLVLQLCLRQSRLGGFRLPAGHGNATEDFLVRRQEFPEFGEGGKRKT